MWCTLFTALTRDNHDAWWGDGKTTAQRGFIWLMTRPPAADRDSVELRPGLPDQQRHPSWLHRCRAKARSNRGVAIVEAAFITPVFFALVLGIMEGGLYMKDYLAMSNAVRAGARSASAAGADGEADLYTLYDISNEAGALGGNQIQYVVVYKASGIGTAPTATCSGGTSAAGTCNVYTPADIAKAVAQVKEQSAQAAAVAAGQTRTLDSSKIWFGCLTTGVRAGQSPDRYWCPGTRADARSSNNKAGPDYVGVWMKVNHGWVTKMFGNTTTMTDQSVIQIEPRSE